MRTEIAAISWESDDLVGEINLMVSFDVEGLTAADEGDLNVFASKVEENIRFATGETRQGIAIGKLLREIKTVCLSESEYYDDEGQKVDEIHEIVEAAMTAGLG